MDNLELIKIAQAGLNNHVISSYDASIAMVSCALETKDSKIYTGVSLSLHCGLGCCAEYNAIGTMLTSNESEIKTIVAVGAEGAVYPPCGRCREVIFQINDNNKNTNVILSENTTKPISELLPDFWYKN